MKLFLILFILFVKLGGLDAGIGFRQSVAAAGRLICDGAPSVGTKIKLYDEDRIDIDDLMAETYTNEQGYFYLSGNDGFTPCQRKLQIRIPDDYITRGATPRRVYHLGVLNLDGEISGEYHDCLN